MGGLDRIGRNWDESHGRRWPAWLLSMILHGTLFLGTAFWIARLPQGAPTPRDRRVGVALVHEDGRERRYESAEEAEQNAKRLEGQQPQPPGIPQGTGDSVIPSQAVKSLDLSGSLPGLSQAGVAAPSALQAPTLSGPVADRGNADRLSSAVNTSVFGAEGTGNKFLYVFDRSGSMAVLGGRPLAAAKRELIASLHDLDENSQFQVLFYNERPSVFELVPGQPRMVWANRQAIEAAERFVRAIAASGGTRHLEPLRMALRLQPDVVFFLTDADEPRLSDEELRQVRSWNAGSILHTIEFGYGKTPPTDNFLVRLARENGGKHVYVDVATLPVRP